MTRTSLGHVLSAVLLRMRYQSRAVFRSALIRATWIGVATVPFCVFVQSFDGAEDGLSTALPFYVLTVRDSHCDHAAELLNGTLLLRRGAVLDVTLRPDSFARGEVTLRSFVEYPQLPPIRLPLPGERSPSRAGTFHLRASMEGPLSLRPGRARVLFVLSRPSGVLKTQLPVRQVLELPIEVFSE